MLWRNFMYLLDMVIYFVQQISAVVILGWVFYIVGKRLLRKLMNMNINLK